MDLNLITPTVTKNLAIAWIELNTSAGNFVIQPGHVPTILVLVPYKEMIFCLRSGKQESILLKHQGIAEITRTGVTVVINENL